MPILARRGETATNPQQRSFSERIKAGRVVPIISDDALFDLVLGGYAAFVHSYADYVEFPLPDKENLVEMARFHQLYQQEQGNFTDEDLKVDYLNYVKNRVYYAAQDAKADADLLADAAAQVDNLPASAFANRLGYPLLNKGEDDPLLVIANLPVKIILTTSPYTFLEDALGRVGKVPHTDLCRWRKELETIDPLVDPDYTPGAAEPLVYHLLGLDRYPDSLVLTEEDYLEFLVNVSQGQGNQAADRIPAIVRKVLSDDLIVLGYRLNSWAFRVLYAGLIKPNGKPRDRGVCTLQLVESEAEKSYLKAHLQREASEAQFHVFWGDLNQYAQQELRKL